MRLSRSRWLGVAASLLVCLSGKVAVKAVSPQLAPAQSQSQDGIAFVNPFIGTGGHGHTFPGACVPFGMVQLSPDTDTKGWDWCSGYHARDRSLAGFSHTHLSGTGCGDLGDILFAPTVGEVKLEAGSKDNPEIGYRSTFSAEQEESSPGYYAVHLTPSGVKAELTATKRVGLHRYTFPKSEQANIIIDLVHGIQDKPIELELNVVNDHAITGSRRSKGWAQDQHVYFAAEFSKPFTDFGTAGDGGKKEPGSKHAKGESVKGWLTFNTNEKEAIVAKVALSTTSIEGALTNLSAEAPDFDFDAARKQAQIAWKRSLSRVRIEGGAKKDLETFYTALYHCYLAPTLISDVDGSYRGSDLNNHTAEGFKCYSTFSLWDTFRAEHPLFTILEPRLVTDMIKSFGVQAQFHKDKTLPIWPLYANETYCMIGYHSFPVIAEAYAKGIRNFDAESLFKYMVDNSKRNDWWQAKGKAAGEGEGYIPADKEEESVSKTLEFAYDDYALAQFARALGKTADYEKYTARSQAYRNLFDKQSGFMRARLQDGSFRKKFDPTAIPDKPRDYTEGNAWQYSWFVPHDVAGLIDLMGGRNAFIKKLDQLFDHAPAAQETKDLDVSGLLGQYAQGNEPSHHVAYLYSYAGCPNKTQERLYQIKSELYNNTREGLCGNEDCGQMSAWYVFSSLGFYPVNPAEGIYVLGAPSFPKATINLPNGRTFTIVARGYSPKCHYVESVSLDNKPLPRVFITHAEIMNGGTLEFVMTDKPGSKWGTDSNEAPPSASAAHAK